MLNWLSDLTEMLHRSHLYDEAEDTGDAKDVVDTLFLGDTSLLLLEGIHFKDLLPEQQQQQWKQKEEQSIQY